MMVNAKAGIDVFGRAGILAPFILKVVLKAEVITNLPDNE
jgi:hypothetical protein